MNCSQLCEYCYTRSAANTSECRGLDRPENTKTYFKMLEYASRCEYAILRCIIQTSHGHLSLYMKIYTLVSL